MPNKIVRSSSPVKIMEDISGLLNTSSAGTIDQGDFCVWDGTAHKVIHPAAEADGATFMGVASVATLLGKLKGPYAGLTDVDASVAGGGIPGPVTGVEFKAVAKTGDTFVPGGLVYLDPATGTRGVTATGTKAIGIALQAVTGAAAGAEIIIRIGHRFPGDTLVL